ncbi:MAG: hypothetical protein K2O73_11055 [Lachnospiraceae bacterium]|nr:hypothetical protein [Lachnospiraceae bacterium]
MRNKFKYYIAAWAVLFVIFHVIVFVTPNRTLEWNRDGSVFWISYIFITVTFVGQLVCAYFAWKEDSSKKLFLKLPLITISGTALVVSIIVGTVCMVIPGLPAWVGVICCVLMLGFQVVAVIKAAAAAVIVSDMDEALAQKTFFIKSLTLKAEDLMKRANTEETKAVCKRVYEVIRYSDPMSNPGLTSEESQIEQKFEEFSHAVIAGAGDISILTDELVLLVENRNRKCKLLK